MSTPAEGPGIAKAMEQRSLYVYKESRDANSPRYERILEFMVLATIRRNPNITENQIRALFRSVYNVPEDMTTRTARMWQTTVLPDNPSQKVLFTERVNTDRTQASSGPPNKHVNVHLKLNVHFNWDNFVQEYSQAVEQDLSHYLPELYKKPMRGS